MTVQVSGRKLKWNCDTYTCFIEGELDTTRPVPFRLTPNIIEYLSAVGINGPLTASMIATARCFVYPNFKVSECHLVGCLLLFYVGGGVCVTSTIELEKCRVRFCCYRYLQFWNPFCVTKWFFQGKRNLKTQTIKIKRN